MAPRLEAGPLGRLALLAQRPTQDLADIRLWKVRTEFDGLRPLVARKLLLAMLEHVLLGELWVFLDDVDLRYFPRVLVGHADHGTFEHARQHHHHLLDFIGEYLETRHDDHVLLAIDD